MVHSSRFEGFCTLRAPRQSGRQAGLGPCWPVWPHCPSGGAHICFAISHFFLQEAVKEGNELDNHLEAMMTSQECFWPDDQIISQSVCDGQEGPFAKHGKALSSVFVQVDHSRLYQQKHSGLPLRWEINMGRGPPQPWLLVNLGM